MTSSLRAEVDSLKINHVEFEKRLKDMEKRFNTLQSPLWKRAWFRIDGWPGIRDLNASRRSWRPWHGRR